MIDVKKHKNRMIYHRGKHISIEKFEKPLRDGKMFRVIDHEGKNVTFEVIWQFMSYYGKTHNINPYPFLDELFKKEKKDEKL